MLDGGFENAGNAMSFDNSPWVLTGSEQLIINGVGNSGRFSV